jgi:hypothetical protein
MPGGLTSKARSSTDIMDMFGHTTWVDDWIDSRDSNGITLGNDKFIFIRESGVEGSDCDKESSEFHCNRYYLALRCIVS